MHLFIFVIFLFFFCCPHQFAFHLTLKASRGLHALEAKAAEGAGQVTNLSVCVFHHMIEGKSHKKEISCIQAFKKCGLAGFIVYGTPGIVVTTGGGIAVNYFLTAAGKAGKKGAVALEVQLDGQQAELMSLLPVMSKKKGLSSATLADLRTVLDTIGQADVYREIIMGLST